MPSVNDMTPGRSRAPAMAPGAPAVALGIPPTVSIINLQLLHVMQISSFLWGTAIPADVTLRTRYNGELPVSLFGPIANPTTRQKSLLTLMNSKANRLWGRDPPVYCNLLSSCDRTSEQKSRCRVVGFAIGPDRLTGSSPISFPRRKNASFSKSYRGELLARRKLPERRTGHGMIPFSTLEARRLRLLY
jgi:hypothetical protein